MCKAKNVTCFSGEKSTNEFNRLFLMKADLLPVLAYLYLKNNECCDNILHIHYLEYGMINYYLGFKQTYVSTVS